MKRNKSNYVMGVKIITSDQRGHGDHALNPAIEILEELAQPSRKDSTFHVTSNRRRAILDAINILKAVRRHTRGLDIQ